MLCIIIVVVNIGMNIANDKTGAVKCRETLDSLPQARCVHGT